MDLLKALATQRHTLAGEMNVILEEAQDTPVRELLRRTAEGWLRLMRQEDHLVSMLLAESLTHPELQQAFNEITEMQIGKFAAYLQTRVEAGELREDLPVRASAMMLTSPLLTFFITNRQLSNEDWEQRARPYIEGLLDHWLRSAFRNRE